MKNSGFSLLELSIVLVIIGLLAGGVMTGQALIRAAELRSISTDISRFSTMMNAFRDKYQAVPGDMRNAVSFWGAQAGGTAVGVDSTCTALTAAASGPATCNGNGDGKIGAVSTEYYERFRAWQQLANAGLLEGSYSGVAGSAGVGAVTSDNSPSSKINNAIYGLFWLGPRTAASDGIFDGNYPNELAFGGASAGVPNSPILKPEEAWGIDTKLDDGKPGFGVIRTYVPATRPNCATAGDSTALYMVSDSGLRCMLFVEMKM